jgi:hypothetical protein
LGEKDLVLERTGTVALMEGTTIYCSEAMRKLQKNVFIKRARARARDEHSRRPATVAHLVEQPIKNQILLQLSLGEIKIKLLILCSRAYTQPPLALIEKLTSMVSNCRSLGR